MTTEEALKRTKELKIKSAINGAKETGTSMDYLNCVETALEKMIAVKPIVEEAEIRGEKRTYKFCRKCHSQVYKSLDDYCPKCGKHIDWTEV